MAYFIIVKNISLLIKHTYTHREREGKEREKYHLAYKCIDYILGSLLDR